MLELGRTLLSTVILYFFGDDGAFIIIIEINVVMLRREVSAIEMYIQPYVLGLCVFYTLRSTPKELKLFWQ